VVKFEVNGLLSSLTKCLSGETDGDFDSVNSSFEKVNARRAPATRIGGSLNLPRITFPTPICVLNPPLNLVESNLG
jgi:hypothetical protein